MASPAIAVRSLSKTYRVAQNRTTYDTAAESLLAWARHPTRRTTFDEFHALDDVSFDVPWGEAVGIIGRNGAGKSTLLKVLTRITAPTKGRIELGGRLGSLLEVGTGFHNELTGRENIYLNGTLLGMKRHEITRRFNDIVEFAGVERFLDTPVKRYSSGMYVRLAFSVAAHLETEILAVDEVLAVGDAEFQAKCLAKMREVATSGRTVLLVSHQVQNVMSLCTTAMYLEKGRLIEYGPVEAAMEHYKRSFELTATQSVDAEQRPGSGEIRFVDAQMSDDVVEPHQRKTIRLSTTANSDTPGRAYISAEIKDQNGAIVVQLDSRLVDFWIDMDRENKIALTIDQPWFKPGRYTVDLFICRAGIIDAWEGACLFHVMEMVPYPHSATDDAIGQGVVFGDFNYTVE